MLGQFKPSLMSCPCIFFCSSVVLVFSFILYFFFKDLLCQPLYIISIISAAISNTVDS
jgi:hypothetical protein